MRAPLIATSDVMNELKLYQAVRETVTQDPENPERWLITFESVPGSLTHSRLHVEVLEEGPVVCVLERENVDSRSMGRIMGRLMRRLDRAPRSSQSLGQSPSGGSPPSSPVMGRRGPREDDN